MSAEELSFATRIENSKAHLNSIVGNLNDANNDLQEVLYERDKVIEELNIVSKEVYDGINNANIIEKRDSKEIEVIKERLRKSGLKFKLNKEKFNDECIERKSKLVKEEVELEDKFYNLIEEIKDLEKNNVILKREYERDVELLNSVKLELYNLDESKLQIEEKLSQLEYNYDKKSIIIKSKIEREKEKLVKIEGKVKNEKDKIKKPMELLLNRKFEIQKKERNLKILINRFNKVNKDKPIRI